MGFRSGVTKPRQLSTEPRRLQAGSPASSACHSASRRSTGRSNCWRGFEQVRIQPGPARSLVRLDAGPVAPFAAVELSVAAIDGAEVVAGLFSASGDSVAAVFSPARRQVRIEVRRDGDTRVVAETAVELQTPVKAAFAVCENQVTALVDTGDGWQPVVTNRDDVAALIDLRDPATLATFSYGYGVGGTGGEARFSRVTAGPFGMAGLRDPHLVQRPDGTAYIRDGKAYLTFTCAGLGFFQQAHWGCSPWTSLTPPSYDRWPSCTHDATACCWATMPGSSSSMSGVTASSR